MAPTKKASSQTSASQSKSNSRSRTVKLDGREPPSSALKRIDPLTAFSKHLTTPPASGSRSSTPVPALPDGKGKSKESSTAVSQSIDDTLWVDRYEPTTEAELAVHVKKVENVRQWLHEAFEGGPSGVLKKYRRILLLTGRAGTGKTSTIRVLSREMGFDILEWKGSAGGTPSNRRKESGGLNGQDTEIGSESLFSRFEAFLTRASTCNNIFSTVPPSSVKNVHAPSRRIVLLEDLPNVLHHETQTRFHQALLSLVNTRPSDPPVPVVIIISDAGLRGEDGDEKITEGRAKWARDKVQVFDARTVIPRELLHSVYVTQIVFNPIAPTLLRKALQSLLSKHFSSHPAGTALSPSKEALDIIVESANGDIRSAIMALQFACVVELTRSKKQKKKGKGISNEPGTTLVMEAVSRREQSLVLFHLLGKVLYNKRKGDPPGVSATAKDLQKEREIDALIKDPSKLPSHLESHERRASRVDIDSIYADSPIDSSLFSLYIHQNYSQFCDDLEHCDGVSEWLSWVDSSGGEAWYQTNPHQFHLLALGTLHSLPSPVQRRSQKYFKPEFFAYFQKEKNAWEGVCRTRDWMVENAISAAADNMSWGAGGWTKTDVILELGGVLKAQDSLRLPVSVSRRTPAPTLHRLFSRMEFVRSSNASSGGNGVRAMQLDEDEDGDSFFVGSVDGVGGGGGSEDVQLDLENSQRDEQNGGWLEADDIEEF